MKNTGDSMELSKNFFHQVETKIVPHIIAAVEASLRAIEQDPPNFTNYSLGCNCWDNLYNRISKNLANDDYFNIKISNKVIEISAIDAGNIIKFYFYRVNEQTRIPNGAKSIKVYAQEQCFLSDEIQDLIIHKNQSVFAIGYDVSMINGLGKITFDELLAIDKNKYQAATIHTFEYDTDLSSEIIISQPEEIQQPIVTKEVLPNSQKEVNKK